MLEFFLMLPLQHLSTIDHALCALSAIKNYCGVTTPFYYYYYCGVGNLISIQGCICYASSLKARDVG